MEYKLSNNHLTLSVKGQGAEVVSLLTRSTFAVVIPMRRRKLEWNDTSRRT